MFSFTICTAAISCALTLAQLPFLFGCIPQCVTCAAKMAFVMQNFIFKGFLFIGLGVVSCHLTSTPSTRVGARVAPHCTTQHVSSISPPPQGWGAMYRLASDAKCAAWILTWSIVLCFSGVLYIVAYAKGERFDEEDNSAKSMGVDTDKIKKDASDAAAKKAVQTARENPEAARSMAQKAASGII